MEALKQEIERALEERVRPRLRLHRGRRGNDGPAGRPREGAAHPAPAAGAPRRPSPPGSWWRRSSARPCHGCARWSWSRGEQRPAAGGAPPAAGAAARVRVRVRYCGGCNPRYDRAALAPASAGGVPRRAVRLWARGRPLRAGGAGVRLRAPLRPPRARGAAFILWRPEGWRDLCRWLRRQGEKQSQETAKGAERVALDDAL